MPRWKPAPSVSTYWTSPPESILMVSRCGPPLGARLPSVPAAAADHEGRADEEQHQGEFRAAGGPVIAVRRLDRYHDDAQLDRHHEGHDARAEAEREQDHADEFEERHHPRPEHRRIEAGF